MKAFEFLYEDFQRGLTVVLDKGLPPKFVEDYLKVCGDYIDFVKFDGELQQLLIEMLLKKKSTIIKTGVLRFILEGHYLNMHTVKANLMNF